MSKADSNSAGPASLVVRGKVIAQDEYGFFCLNDMWRVSGQEHTRAPRYWRVLPTTRDLTEALNSNARFSCVWEKIPEKSAIYSRKGNRGGTFAYVILALAYAEYLDPQLGIEVREIALRYWSGDVSLLDDFVKRRDMQAEEDGNRIIAREKIREDNSNLQFRILHGLGARSRGHYAAFHNAGYQGLYDGEDENDIHRRKRLKRDQRILDHMSFAELAANMFRTSQVEQRLRKFPAETLGEACAEHLRMGQRVRDFMRETGSDMPEEMPVADSITAAKKRLRDYEKSQKKLK